MKDRSRRNLTQRKYSNIKKKSNKTENQKHIESKTSNIENQIEPEQPPFYSIPPPPLGLAYIPSYMFESIVNSFQDIERNNKKEIDIFVKEYNDYISEKQSNVLNHTNSFIEWLDIDSFINNYVLQLIKQQKVEKLIIEYGIVNGLRLLIKYYNEEVYDGMFENTNDIIDYINNENNFQTNYETAAAILKNVIGHKSRKDIMGF